MSIAILTAAALSAASPIYLSCTIQQDEGDKVFEVMANEQTGRAAVTFSNGRTAQHPAVFTPSELRVGDRSAGWIISRVNLAIRQTIQIGSKTFVDEGTCKLQPAPADRAF